MLPTRRVAQSVWQAFTTQRRAYGMGGISAPSSKNLWDIMKKEQLEGHDARHIHDIWMEVRDRGPGTAARCCGVLSAGLTGQRRGRQTRDTASPSATLDSVG